MEVQDNQGKENLAIQTLNTRQGKPTKYKTIEPTLAEDLSKHNPYLYSAIPDHSELDLLGEDDLIKIALINREDIWLFVERVEEDTDIIYAKVAQRVKRAHELQEGQRVAVKKEHVCEIKYHDAHDDSD
ncbi:hypothetical protein COCSUDRAFT_55365 [Coccomyxa subellipsoidea C-169]|uniref:Uncharacterized protein n=1 Tax=Coccomyxa subellipsoidea (strain C-169) TaxID=574566 RepID=I0Z9N0_COCSC|nr:hypothetical protein COCSUDRAFT_55365 [Coccomyxa subellipsoidea C-169]EIE27349.1 hypothetical protein COCSUDRAFT_55365 [Coccomyxa subellipsoidea C-169]|eukprot:XP_005651893.1 hypothetical protein COCSUDRAFT_55365 [Coccomyxa subellipsoidea C-169]